MHKIATLRRQLESLAREVEREGDEQTKAWGPSIDDPRFAPSAHNLACYLALRRRDVRPIQRSLMALGLSSLGRLESRVLPTLAAVQASLAAIAGDASIARPSENAFFAGEHWLAERRADVLGASSADRPVALLVTCPSEAADDAPFMLNLAERGVEAIRINCAHDDAAGWQRMIDHAHSAEAITGRRMRIFMDLAGPKIRTGMVHHPKAHRRIGEGDLLVVVPSGGLASIDLNHDHFAVECTLGEAISATGVGDQIFYDDGKLGAKVERVEPWGIVARAVTCPADGAKLKPEKGLNFPDAELGIAALTEKDRADLDFVAAHADGIGYSFVQSARDVAVLQDALAERRDDWRKLALILKIETPKGVANLPEIVVRAAGRQPTAIMIARGDLAVEIGFARTAEMQEEILWMGEAAHVPVIWATQVLEHLVCEGLPSRGEMTDAAMAARAECVMLNKGPYLLAAVDMLGQLFRRMDEHQHKKTPQLRALKSW
ncbi:pyruvate kinase [Sphingomonas sp. YR710]|uniref:pyruvate kinase n=1 Tax=Sphingomonas sp. YR710 TaxID=1882773 RepID=UPI0008810048|nr:pyruvate kinase [Sphingomonas sp. YR710]SDD21051.1 pyruvate kinase [Sphingomonas sp. YR710]